MLKKPNVRGFSCGVSGFNQTNQTAQSGASMYLKDWTDQKLCTYSTALIYGVKKWETRGQYELHVQEAKRRGLSCGVSGFNQTNQTAQSGASMYSKDWTDQKLCTYSTALIYGVKKWETRGQYELHVQEAKRRGLSCGVSGFNQTNQTAQSGSSLTSNNTLALQQANQKAMQATN